MVAERVERLASQQKDIMHALNPKRKLAQEKRKIYYTVSLIFE
jgi:hypothetical protein